MEMLQKFDPKSLFFSIQNLRKVLFSQIYF